MNVTDSPGRDPVLLAIQAGCLVLAVIAVVLICQRVQSARAQAAHPCPSWNFPVLAPTGWGCAQTATFGWKTVKSR